MIPAGVKDALKANSNSNNPYEDGLNAYRAGNGQKAIAAFNQFLSSNPSGEEALLALYWLGDVYYNERNYSEAERYLELVQLQLQAFGVQGFRSSEYPSRGGPSLLLCLAALMTKSVVILFAIFYRC